MSNSFRRPGEVIDVLADVVVNVPDDTIIGVCVDMSADVGSIVVATAAIASECA